MPDKKLSETTSFKAVVGSGLSSQYGNRNQFKSFSQNNILSVPVQSELSSGQATAADRWLLVGLLRLLNQPPIRFQLWDGTQIDPIDVTPRFTLTLLDRKSVFLLISNPSLHFGDLYSAGRLRVEGDLVDLMEAIYDAIKSMKNNGSTLLKTLWRDHAPRSTSIHDARDNIHHHYDLGNNFYSLWLDQEAMQYTCAYYAEPAMTLEQAQVAKMEHVCRKLMLKPGMKVVEAGSGWGGLARYMARQHGVQVTSYNISKEQIAFAREKARQEGIAERVTFIEDDYRNIQGHFDAFVSVGMLEHVGLNNYAELAKVVDRCLRPDGMGLIHSIGRNRPSRMNAWIEKRIFPGAYPPSISEFMDIFESGPFSVLDVENLRLHYAQTLEHWLQRFEQHRPQIESQYDDSFVRAWRLYLAGSIAAFTSGSLQLFQVAFAREHNNRIPRTRSHLYVSDYQGETPQIFTEPLFTELQTRTAPQAISGAATNFGVQSGMGSQTDLPPQKDPETGD